jgi:hypothetical protein
MFERYTETARRVIFFARYEASQFGCEQIETEHILLGVLREDHFLGHRFNLSPEDIRHKIEERVKIRKKVSTSADLPVSNESKRVLAYAAEESARLRQTSIGSEHLFLGLLREDRSFAADLLHASGLRLDEARIEISKWPSSGTRENRLPPEGPLLILIAGPYRSGTNDDPALIQKNVEAMESYALPIFRLGHIPILGEWLALPLVHLAGSAKVGDEAFNEIFHPIAVRLLEKCDAVLRVGGPSAGADEMVRVGRSLGLAIFSELSDIPAIG